MTVLKLISAATLTLALVPGVALAKAHDQSGNLDDMPGFNVGAETVTPAHTLGAALGNGKKPAGPNGKSADAGNPQ